MILGYANIMWYLDARHWFKVSIITNTKTNLILILILIQQGADTPNLLRDSGNLLKNDDVNKLSIYDNNINHNNNKINNYNNNNNDDDI